MHSQSDKELGALKGSIHYKLKSKYFSICSLIAISDSVQKSINNFYSKKSKLIMNGANYCSDFLTEKVKRYFSDPEFIYLLAVGNTRKEKNFNLLISSFKKVSESHKIKLIVLGALVEEFKDIDVNEYEAENIYFLGSVENVQDYMKCSDFLCMTSKYEGMPITLLEAMANDLIPIVTPVSGIIDIIDQNYNGIISNDSSVKSYSEALNFAILLPEFNRKKMRNNGSKLYKNKYSMKICEANYYQFYTDLINIK